MASPGILVLGSSAVDKLALVSRVVGTAVAPSSSSIPWKIDNKYYTANVTIQVKNLDDCDVRIDEHLEAVVLVFNIETKRSFTCLQSWWESNGVAANPAIKLVVGMANNSSSAAQQQQPSWLFEAQQWCSDQLIEYVTLSRYPAAHSFATAPPETDSEGLDRLVEALQAHMWPGLKLKPRDGSSVLISEQSEAQQNGALEDRSLEDASSGRANPAGEHINNHLEAAAHSSSLLDDDDQAENLDLLFAELAGARDRLQHLNDADRREAAASLVMRLMGAMGLEDDEGHESEDGAENIIQGNGSLQS